MANSLENFVDPVVEKPWSELAAVRRSKQIDGRLHAEIQLGYPVVGLGETYRAELANWLGESNPHVDLHFVPPDRRPLSGVRNVICVASGKGGVGKSTTAVNLALGLTKAGAKVGLLDADIYGPSQGQMLGIAEGHRPNVRDEKYFEPIKAHGLQAISMSMMITERTPMVWRGPMASSALQQLLQQTLWEDLDYLVVDMPPGTGDIQLTLSQRVTVGGAVIVTTPQSIALADARKGIEMFSKVNVPVLGVVENMSYFQCDGCGKTHRIFDSDGGQNVADEYNTTLLGQLPLHTNIREQTDSGAPPVVADPDGEVAALYVDAARRAAGSLWLATLAQAPKPKISIDNA